MSTYRVFTLGGDDHITGANILECPNDFEALVLATEFSGEHKAVEVWEFARRVGRVDVKADAE